MLRGLLRAMSPTRLMEAICRPFCWDLVLFQGEHEIEANAITGEYRHRIHEVRGTRSYCGPWVPGFPYPVTPVDLDTLPSASEMALRFCPINAPIPVPNNER